jgi:hypothetical protein
MQTQDEGPLYKATHFGQQQSVSLPNEVMMRAAAFDLRREICV